MTITIGISDEVWEELMSRKKAGQSFDEVLRKVLKIEDENVRIKNLVEKCR